MARGLPGPLALAGALLVLAAVAGSSPWLALARQPAARQTSDFQILHAAGQGLAEGLDVHDPAVLDRVGQRVGRPATPFCAAVPLVVGAFGLFGAELDPAYESWLIVNMLAGLLAAAALAACLRGSMSRSMSWALALLLVALPAPFWHSLAMNSTNLPALAALALAALAGERRRFGLEGLALALAILVKTSPALVLLTMLMAGRLAPVLWAVGWLAGSVGAAILWLGWEVHVSWVTRVLPVLGYAPQVAAGRFNNALHAWNLSPNGLLTRAAEGATGWAAAGAWLVTALVLTQLLGAVRAARSRQAEPAGGVADVGGLYALSVAAMFLVSSVTWPHHLVFAAVPGAWLLRRLSLASGRGHRGAVVCGLLAWAVLALPLGLFGEGRLQSLDIPIKTVACLVLFGSLVWAVGPLPAGAAGAVEGESSS